MKKEPCGNMTLLKRYSTKIPNTIYLFIDYHNLIDSQIENKGVFVGAHNYERSNNT